MSDSLKLEYVNFMGIFVNPNKKKLEHNLGLKCMLKVKLKFLLDAELLTKLLDKKIEHLLVQRNKI